jgi:transcriptional regulator with XRE-family HTH domain
MMQKEGQTGVTAIGGAGKKTAIPQKKIIITERRLNRIKARMAELGITQATLADKIGVSAGAVSLMLAGKTHRTQYFPDIAEALKADLDWLLGKRDGEYDEDQLELGEHLEGAAQETVALLPEIDLLGATRSG